MSTVHSSPQHVEQKFTWVDSILIAPYILRSLTRDWTCAPSVEAQSVNHWTSREIPADMYCWSVCLLFFFLTCTFESCAGKPPLASPTQDEVVTLWLARTLQNSATLTLVSREFMGSTRDFLSLNTALFTHRNFPATKILSTDFYHSEQFDFSEVLTNMTCF